MRKKIALALLFLSAWSFCQGLKSSAQSPQVDTTALNVREQQFDPTAFAKSSTPDGKRNLRDPKAVASWCYTDMLQQAAFDYDRAKDFDKGEQAFQKLYALHIKAFGEKSVDTSYVMNQLALHYERCGKLKLAEQLSKKCIDTQESLIPGDVKIVFSLQTLYHIYLDEGRPQDAADTCKRELSVAEKFHGNNTRIVAYVLEGYYGVLMTLGKKDEAKAVLARALDIRTLTHTMPDPSVMGPMNQLLAERNPVPPKKEAPKGPGNKAKDSKQDKSKGSKSTAGKTTKDTSANQKHTGSNDENSGKGNDKK